jgi:hypothetical protein
MNNWAVIPTLNSVIKSDLLAKTTRYSNDIAEALVGALAATDDAVLSDFPGIVSVFYLLMSYNWHNTDV